MINWVLRKMKRESMLIIPLIDPRSFYFAEVFLKKDPRKLPYETLQDSFGDLTLTEGTVGYKTFLDMFALKSRNCWFL